MTHPVPLLLRAVVAFVALPGIVAGLVPWLLFQPARGSLDVLGLGPMAAGAAMLLWCASRFYVAGRGTLAPWDPPRELVISGPYRFSRNPMYVAVLLILAGWTIAYRSWGLAWYTIAIGAAFHLRVVRWEEPRLARAHGAAWDAYAAAVPRWLLVSGRRK